jgi:hypothetical protein
MQAAIFKIGDESVEYSQIIIEFGANQATIVDADINKKVLAFKMTQLMKTQPTQTVGSSGFHLVAPNRWCRYYVPNKKIIPTGLFSGIPENF